VTLAKALRPCPEGGAFRHSKGSLST